MTWLDQQVLTARYDAGQSQMLSLRRSADLETPVSAMLKLTGGKPGSFLLESVEGGAVKGRYSIIGMNPDLIWRCRDGKAEISQGGDFLAVAEPPLDSLRALVANARIDHAEGLPPAIAGLVGYLGYDMVRLVEVLGAPPPDPLDLPDALLLRPTLIAVFDGVKDELILTTPVRPQPGLAAAQALQFARERLEEAAALLDQGIATDDQRLDGNFVLAPPVSNTSPARYQAMVAQAQDYILAGDIFQVVLSQRFSTPFPLPAIALYRSLRRTNPSPFLFLLNFEGLGVVGSSPEILVRLRDDEVTIRPIAGTRRRGATLAEDQALAAELLADPKECAEHLMLLDLGRNDVGRVAEPGSVAVTERFMVEYYSHVMHIVSNVAGRIAPGHDAIDALFAGFPAGTVSGAPKIRAMEIIDELETHKRGIYAGAVGYFGIDGSMDSCIVLRTAILHDGVLHAQAGAGIVADSNPLSEQRECEAKARALIVAAEDAITRAAQPRNGQ